MDIYRLKISSLPCKRLRLGHRKGSWKIQEKMCNRNQYFQENYPRFISRTRTPPLIDLPYTLPLSIHTPCELGIAVPHCTGNKTEDLRYLHISQRQGSKKLGFEPSISSLWIFNQNNAWQIYKIHRVLLSYDLCPTEVTPFYLLWEQVAFKSFLVGLEMCW